MWRRASALVGALAVVVVAGAGCQKPDGASVVASVEAGTSADERPGPVAREALGARDAGARSERGEVEGDARGDAGVATGVDAGAYVDAAPRSGKSIGNTSVVFKLELASGVKAAFKPHTRRGPNRYKGEIAAYRLGRALGLDNVPVAFPRTFGRGELEAALARDPRAAELLATEVIADGDRVRGAVVPWIDGLETLPLESEPLGSRWRAWVSRGTFADDEARALGKLAGASAATQRSIAAQASTLVVFDYLTGNWDRWSGANVGYLKRAERVLYIDNDGAFFARAPADALARNERLLASVDRFSRAVVERLRALDDATLAAALGDERPGVPLLDREVLALLSTRRAEALAVIDAKIQARGEAETLFFP